MIASILSGILKQISILLSVALTAYLVGAAVAGTLLQNFKYLLAVLIVCILLRAVANFGEMGFSHDVAFRVLRDYRISIYDKISKLAPAFTLRKKTGQLGQALGQRCRAAGAVSGAYVQRVHRSADYDRCCIRDLVGD